MAALAALAALISLTAVSVTPAAAATPQRYRDPVFAKTTKTTYVYKSAPDLVTGKLVPLRLDVYRPVGDTLAKRPAIIWIHGGGFRFGDRSAMGAIAAEWAQKGYVTVSISYRLDTRGPCQALATGGKYRRQVHHGAQRLAVARAGKHHRVGTVGRRAAGKLSLIHI